MIKKLEAEHVEPMFETPNKAIACAVIEQAVKDASLKKAVTGISMRDIRDAKNFLKTDRLDKFIEKNHLNINAIYFRQMMRKEWLHGAY